MLASQLSTGKSKWEGFSIQVFNQVRLPRTKASGLHSDIFHLPAGQPTCKALYIRKAASMYFFICSNSMHFATFDVCTQLLLLLLFPVTELLCKRSSVEGSLSLRQFRDEAIIIAQLETKTLSRDEG